MGILRRALAALTVGAAGACAAVASCQAVVPPDQFFNGQGITQVVSYPNASPPSALTATTNYLFYVQGAALVRLPLARATSPEVVQSLPGTLTGMAFDGEHTLAWCAGSVMQAIDPDTLANVSLPQADAGGCLRLALNPTQLAYTAVSDAGQLTVVSLPIDGGSQSTYRRTANLNNDAGTDPAHAVVALVGNQAYYVWRQAMYALGRYERVKRVPCRVAFVEPADNPKAVVFDSGTPDGPRTSIVLRTNSADVLKRVDFAEPDGAACCSSDGAAIGPCAHEPLPEQAPGQAGDFIIASGHFYYSANGGVTRVPLDEVSPHPTGTLPAAFVDIPGGAPVPGLAVAGANVYFIVGNSIFQAPLPAP